MAPIQRTLIARYTRLTVILCASLLGGTAHSTSRIEVYQTTVPITNHGEAAQAAAFQTALKNVLVRATGRRNADEEAVFAPLIGNARRYVQQFRNASDNRLWVAFDGAALERWLIQNGEPVWGRDRPTTFVWLTQGGGALTSTDQSELKLAIDAAAAVRGIPLLWPSTASAAGAESNAAIADMGRKAGADATLIGRANGTTGASVVHWTLLFADHGGEFSGLSEGINRTADQFATLYAASGALAPLDIEITGIEALRDYAGIETYLESLTFITHVAVDELAGDAVRFRLTMRGGIDALQRAVALGGRLQPMPVSEDGIQRFQLRR